MYTLVPLYHEMKTNKKGPTCEFNMRKNHIACSSKTHNGKILKWMRVESRHQTRSLVSLVDDGVLLLTIAFWLDERENFFNTPIKIPWISSKINYESVYPFKPGSLAVAWYEKLVGIGGCFYHHNEIDFKDSPRDEICNRSISLRLC